MDRLCSVFLGCAVFAAAISAQGIPPVPVPPGNPITTAKVNLGKTLFWDEQLSSTKTMACATCHLPGAGGGDPRTARSVNPGFDGMFGTDDDVHGSPGVVGNDPDGSYHPVTPFGLRPQVTSRKSPPVINAAFNQLQFWDGRADERFVDPVTGQVVLTSLASLETQAIDPPLSPVEMAHASQDWASLAALIAGARPLAMASNLPPALASWIGNRSYPQLFQEAFGSPVVSARRILMAIATYERTLISDSAPFDAFLAGNTNALTLQQRVGFSFFSSDALCHRCHTGALLTDGMFHNIGVRPADEDRGRALVTNAPEDEGAFKTPSLRNTALTGPYFHNGRFSTLEEVVDFYARGGDFHENQSSLIESFQMTAFQRTALVDFLQNALTDPRVAAGLPPFDAPTLYSRSQHVPTSYGFGTAGSSGMPPYIVALEPPALGNDNFAIALVDGFTLTVGEASTGSPAALLLDVLPSTGPGAIPGLPIWIAGTPAAIARNLPLAGAPQTGGFASVVLSLPSSPTLAGTSIFLQGVVVDGSAAVGVTATAGTQVTLFEPR